MEKDTVHGRYKRGGSRKGGEIYAVGSRGDPAAKDLESEDSGPPEDNGGRRYLRKNCGSSGRRDFSFRSKVQLNLRATSEMGQGS